MIPHLTLFKFFIPSLKQLKWVCLVSGLLALSLAAFPVLGVTIQDNSLNFATERLAEDQPETLGRQTSQGGQLFSREASQTLAQRQGGKAALSRQQRQLFTSQKSIKTSQQETKALFSSQQTHALSLEAGQSQGAWPMMPVWIYLAISLVAISLAGVFSWLSQRRDD